MTTDEETKGRGVKETRCEGEVAVSMASMVGELWRWRGNDLT